ncbi:MAG: hypothetical protein U1G07_04840 [Verrucomicrobiota bacterium]
MTPALMSVAMMPFSRVKLFSLSLVACLLAGCVSEPKAKAPVSHSDGDGGGPIDEINLLAIPVALNMDQNPGLDGFVIKVYASNHSRPKPVAIERGKIEILMFDGIPGVTRDAAAQPRRVWTYAAEELKPFEIHTSIGTGYQLAPLWGADEPSGNKITVGVRYTPPQGPAVNSAPSIISVGLK